MNATYKILLILAISLCFNGDVFSQWTCRSKLSANLKPFSKELPLSWAVESTIGHGYMNDREISNAMMFAGLDYSFGKHQFYFEGAVKAWRNTLDKRNNDLFNKYYFGIREGFYKYYTKTTSLTAGVQQFQSSDYFLVKERAPGINYKRNIGRIDIDANIASVLKDNSRFGSFCSVHYLYNTIRNRHYPYIGEKFGNSNFASVSIKYTPSKTPLKRKETTNDEFEDFESEGFDEFEDFETTSEKTSSSLVNYLQTKLLSEAGLIVYQEFGTRIDTSRIYIGAFTDFALPWNFSLKSELLHQEITNQRALIYHFRLSKHYRWKNNSRTAFALGYFGKLNYSNEAKAQMSFSNLFIGEVMRLDAYDMPLVQLSMKHNFPKIRLHVKLQGVKQFTDDNISELNLAIGKTFLKNVKLTGMFSKMDANSLDQTYYMGRLELRVTI